MKTRTLTADTIHAALAEARRLFGDDVVLLESVPPQGEAPARITIMTDKVAPRRQPEQAQPDAVRPMRFGYGAQATRPRTAAAQAGTTRSHDAFSASLGGYTATLAAEEAADDQPLAGLSRLLEQQRNKLTGGRGRLFGGTSEAVVPVQASYARPSLEAIERAFDDRFQRLHERLEEMDRRFETSLIGTSQRWASHPLFRLLLSQGMQPPTLARLFDRLAGRGLDPHDDATNLQWALAQELRQMLDGTTARQLTGTHLFLGPGGSGKTSLILKLANHQGFFGRYRTTVICLLPEDETEATLHNPVDLYRRFGLPVQGIQTEAEMEQALQRVRSFDQILIDTPPLPAQDAALRKALTRLHRLVSPIVPLHVHWVADATREQARALPDRLRRMPLAPDAVALTHLDETEQWGRTAEHLIAFDLPVQFASESPHVHNGAVAYSPTWFVERLLQL